MRGGTQQAAGPGSGVGGRGKGVAVNDKGRSGTHGGKTAGPGTHMASAGPGTSAGGRGKGIAMTLGTKGGGGSHGGKHQAVKSKKPKNAPTILGETRDDQ